jgi:hypothetical protein
LPPHLAAALTKAKAQVLPKARGLVYNAKMLEVSRTLALVHSHLEPGAKTVTVPAATAPPRPAALGATKPLAASAPPVPAPAPTVAPPAPSAVAAPSVGPAAPAVDQTPLPVAIVPEAAPEPAAPAVESQVASEPAAAGGGTISPEQPALVMFVLDRSVQDPFSGSTRHSCALLQEQMGDILEQIVKFGNGAIDVGVVSYGVDGMGEVEVRTTLEGSLSGRVFARDSELESGAVRIDEAVEELSNGVGGLITIQHRRPILIEAEPTFAASATKGFAEVAQLLANWCRDNPSATFPPIVLHLTRGQLTADDVTAATAPLATIATSSGAPVTLYHLVATETEQATVICPDNELALQDGNLQALFRISSLLLGRDVLAQTKPAINGSSRGLVVNGKPNLLLDALRRARGT